MLIWNSIHKSLKITSGGKKYDLQDSADGACATNWGPFFVTIGGEGWYWRRYNAHGELLAISGYWWQGVHGAVVWWEIWTNISFQFYPSYSKYGVAELYYFCPTIPDLLEPRRDHACTRFKSSSAWNKQVWFKNCPFGYSLFVKTGLVGCRRCQCQWRISLKRRGVLSHWEEGARPEVD